MPDPLVTFTTDFGTSSPYVAAMKGALLSVTRAVQIIDLSHEIPPQDICFASFFLAASLPCFPAGSLHVAVVDPGVGTKRALLLVEYNQQRLLVPDNGCWTQWLGESGQPTRVVRLTEPRFWRQPISTTFHGRDILAPVAGHLSLGIEPLEFGPLVTEWVRWREPAPQRTRKGWKGQVVFVDSFGNIITNIPGEALRDHSGGVVIKVGEYKVTRVVRSYGEARIGAVVALVSSTNRLEIASNQGKASKKLKASVGTLVRVDNTLPK